MGHYSEILLSGGTPSPEDWVAYLKDTHRATGLTPVVFAAFQDANGTSSYQLLADTLLALPAPPKTVLDLACGDGHLAPLIHSRCPEAHVTGVDMSSHELAVARAKNLSYAVFKNEMAQSLSEKSGSVDAILCHMALMLMTPLEPVVHEIHRVLRPGGLFAAVVGNPAAISGFFPVFQNELQKFIAEKYPKFGVFTSGDVRFKTAAPVESILPSPFFSNVVCTEKTLMLQSSVENVWTYFKDMYLVTALPEKDREELRRRVNEAAQARSSGGKIVLDFPLRLITCDKNG